MKKSLITVLLSVILAFAPVFGLAACVKNEPFTVTFDMNREGARLAAGYEDYELVQKVTHYSQLKIPVFVCEDAYHVDWNGIISTINSDTVLKAVWSEKSFVITFEPGAVDAVLESGSESITTNEPAYITKPVYTRKGYTMDTTWGGFNFEELKDSCTVTAKWIPNQYKIFFTDSEGDALVFEDGTNVSYDENNTPYIDINYDQSIGQLPVLKEKDGKVFGAWKVSGQTSTKVFNESTYKNDYDLTLEAVWVEEGQYIISYVNVDTTDNPVVYRGSDVQDKPLVLNNPTREGYVFLGWTTEEGSEDYMTAAIIEQGATGNKTFIANWRIKSYSVELDALSGGTVTPEYFSVTYGQKVGELPVPVREGYDFVAWKTPNGTLISKDTVWTIDDSSIVLSAVYKRIYTVKFVLKCDVRGEEVPCTFVAGTYEHIGLVESETEENTYVWSGVKEGTAMPMLPKAKPYDTGEYAFSSWKHVRTVNGREKKVTVNAGWLINEEKFPGTYESGVIVITVYCYALWTPYY